MQTDNLRPTLLDIHRGEPNSIIGYPFENVVTVQQMMTNQTTRTAMTGLLSVTDLLTANQKKGSPDDYVGTGILYYCVFNPMEIAQLEGNSHEDSIRLMLLDIRDFANFIANRQDKQKRTTTWSPRFHHDSKIYAANILSPTDDPPEEYQDKNWYVYRYRTIVPGVYLETSEELGYVDENKKWIFPQGEHFQYVLNADELMIL